MGADTLQQHLAAAAESLSADGAAAQSSARLDAELLLAHTLGRPRSYLLAHADRVPDAATRQRFATLIGRRLRGEPLAYLIGEREFWSLTLTVTPAVLIPRPETELVVERALALRAAAAPATTPTQVLDLGTGSGAIALALAYERPAWQITATDLSGAALAVAQANATRLGLVGPDAARLQFLQGCWFEPVAGRRFDLIVSNPPYVAAGDPALQALQFEPQQALTSGPDGLDALHTLIAHAGECLHGAGHVVFEHGNAQAAAVQRALVAAGFRHVRCHRDLAGHERVTEAQWS